MFFSPLDIAAYKNVGFRFIETRLDGHVFSITLARPEKRNAFTPTMVNEIAYALSFAQASKGIRCVVVKALGPVFCAGMDLKAFHDPAMDTENPDLPKPSKEVNLGDAFRMMTKPTVAKVEGPVLAGGFLITCGCTFVVATEDAEFSLPEVKWGLFPMQVISSLLQITTSAKALQMCILAETYSGRAARDLGLVSHLCDKGSIDEVFSGILEKLCHHSPFAISKGLQAFRTLPDLPEHARFGFLASQLKELKSSADAKEGIAAFNEKRNPVWENQ